MKAKEITFYATAAIALGLAASLVWHTDSESQEKAKFEENVRLTAPEAQEKAYGDFSLRLLQATLQTGPGGNVLIAPNSMAAMLNRLKELCDDSHRKALDALALPQEWALTSADVRELALLFIDKDLPLRPGREIETDIIPTPFRKSLADAIVSINNAVSLYTENRLNRTVASETMGAETALMAVNGVAFKSEWIQPVSQAETQSQDFFNGNGGMPRVPMMRHCGAFRTARAANGEWEAVAFFFRNSAQNGDTACMVAILPREESARSFAGKTLTPTMLAEIRRALYEATPEPGIIEMPRLIYPPTVQDMHATLSHLGLGGLFMDEAPFPGLSEHSPLHIDQAAQQCSVQLMETGTTPPKTAPAQDLPVRLRFDRPFVWFVGNLTSPAEPYLMGVVEDL